jgi:outer membrane protein assembly factor BamB
MRFGAFEFLVILGVLDRMHGMHYFSEIFRNVFAPVYKTRWTRLSGVGLLAFVLLLTASPSESFAWWGKAKSKSSSANQTKAAPSLMTQSRGAYLESSLQGQRPLGKTTWKFKADQQILTSPAVDAEAVYIANSLGEVFAVSQVSGSVVWKTELKETVSHASPLLSDNLLLIGTEKGRLVALDKTSGQVQWEFKGTGRIDATPVLDSKNGMVYLATRDGKLFGVSLANGEKRFEETVSAAVAGSLWVYDKTLFYGDASGKCVALDLDTHETRWVFQGKGSVLGSPVVSQDGAYFATSQGALYALETQTGQPKWTYITPGGESLYAVPAVYRDTVFIADTGGVITALSAKDGKLKWLQHFDGVFMSSPSIVDDVLYITSGRGSLMALDIQTGGKLWEAQLKSLTQSTAVIRGSKLFVGTANGYLMLLE